MLDLVALATVCDVVPLNGLNRAFVVKGLLAMREQQNAGLAALSRVGADSASRSTPYHLGFLHRPAHQCRRPHRRRCAGQPAAGDWTIRRGEVIAADARRPQPASARRWSRRCWQEARAEATPRYGAAGRRRHRHGQREMASRHRRADRRAAQGTFRRPAFAIAFDPNGTGTGSGRSIAGFDLGRLVRAAVDEGLIVKGGGHAMAAGITVERDSSARCAPFSRSGPQAVASLVANETLKIDGAIGATAPRST